MSFIQDYIARGYRGLSNLQQIVEGNYNQLLDALHILPEEKKDIAEKRLKLCSECNFNSSNARKRGTYTSYLSDPHCTICTCPTQVKVLSMDTKCPLDEIVSKGEEMFQYVDDKIYPIRGANNLYKIDVQEVSEGGETIMINGEKYFKYIIKPKFNRE